MAALAVCLWAPRPLRAQPAGGGDTVPSFRNNSATNGGVAVGEPVSVPVGVPQPPAADAVAAGPLPGAGTGWLGLTADDALVTGRVSVVEVAPDGPAAKAGIRPQDVLLSLEGKPLANEEDLAAVLAAIAPGQQVTAAVGRDGRVEDAMMVAGPRPVDPRARSRQEPSVPPPPAALPPAGADPGRTDLQPPAAASALPAPIPTPPFAPPAAVAAPAVPPVTSLAPPAVPEKSVLVRQEPAAFGVVPAAAQQPPVSTSPAAGTAPAWGAAPPLAPLPPQAAATPPVPVTALPVAPSASVPAAIVPPAITAGSAWAGNTAHSGSPTRFAEPGQLPSPAGTAPRSGRPPEAAPGRLALGVRTIPVDGTAQSRFRLPDPGGALVVGVVHDLPASRAGVPPGSVIVALNNRPVRSPQDLSQAVSGGPAGVPVPIQYVLPGGEARRADVVLVALEASLERALAGAPAVPEAASAPAVGPAASVARRIDAPAVPISDRGDAAPTGGAADAAILPRLEELLRRLNDRLESVENRLQRFERGGR